jgi:nicotinamidase-related amidase
VVSTFDRSGTALLVIDVQVGVVGDAYQRDEVVANINTAITKARTANVPVIWVQHSDEWMAIDSDDWQLVTELAPVEGDRFIRKNFKSSFESTNLDEVLAELSVGHLVITGAQSDNCVRHTTHAALERGYDVTLVEDAHTTSDGEWDNGPLLPRTIIDELNRSFHHYDVPGRRTVSTPVAALTF